MKKSVKIFGTLLLVSLLLAGCTLKKDKNKDKEPEIIVNESENVVKDQELEVFSFKHTTLYYEDNTSVLTTVVTNNSSETQYLEEFKIHVLDKEGNEMVTLTGFVGDHIDAGASETIISSYGDDISSADSITYEIVR